MNEYATINALIQAARKAGGAVADPFLADAEIFHVGEAVWAISTDTFSAEDLFGKDPRHIGYTSVMAALSDLSAIGATPQFVLCALSLPQTPTDPTFGEVFYQGIGEALQESNTLLLGGDLGVAPTWQCTLTVLGPVQRPQPLRRVIPSGSWKLFVTGQQGRANLAALQHAPIHRLHLRHAPSTAVACTDTSGGLIDALFSLSTASPHHTIHLDLDEVPYASAVHALPFPPEAFLCAGAGDYELLYAAPDDTLLETTPDTCIGTITPATHGGVFVNGKPLLQPPPDPRSYDLTDRNGYIEALLRYVAPWKRTS